MSGLVVQHNLSAKNAKNKMNANVSGLKKSTEKLSSGYQINRAGDNAAGLAISEKMRSQIRGLAQATRNANDGISLIQTAEGGLNETHSILQRMRELAVQSANGTYTEEDRDAIQLEADALKEEIDRISEATEYNTMKLLDGSLSGSDNSNNVFGAIYGATYNGNDLNGGKVIVTSSVANMHLVISLSNPAGTNAVSGRGGENAIWDRDASGNYRLTINLNAGQTYTDDEINELIKNATTLKDEGLTVPTVTYKSQYNVTIPNSTLNVDVCGDDPRSGGTKAGKRSTATVDVRTLSGSTDATNAASGYADAIKFTANTYGSYVDTVGTFKSLVIVADRDVGKEEVTLENGANGNNAEIKLHLATGVEYTEKQIHDILSKAGYDYNVEFSDTTDPDGTEKKLYFSVAQVDSDAATVVDGVGVGRDSIISTGEGLIFQIGANGVEDQRVALYIDDMSSEAIGVASVDVSDRDKANLAIEVIDEAIAIVSMQRAGLGALQNRLEYTVNNLTITEENLTNAESQIRDTDMATEMVNYTKYNILQQASQAMLAQANQQPQAVLQLLG